MTTQKVYLEHANITVSNINEAVRFFQTAFPQFTIRGGGGEGKDKWLHLGDEHTYIALNQGKEEKLNNHPDYHVQGINHIGFVVDNVAEISERLEKAGFVRDYPKQIQKYRIRDYYADADGNQYEFVEYLSDSVEERNSYKD
ncbi:MAG: VOC family protein [Flavobacteriales bacterium]|nr:VOC family protein [Flavobacteriales bacterium]